MSLTTDTKVGVTTTTYRIIVTSDIGYTATADYRSKAQAVEAYRYNRKQDKLEGDTDTYKYQIIKITEERIR